MSKFQCKQSSKFNLKFKVTLIALLVVVAATFIVRSRTYAVGGQLKSGWNFINWKTEQGSEVNFSRLPVGCDQLSNRRDGWFESWVRDYSPDGKFEPNKNYFVYCFEDKSWEF